MKLLAGNCALLITTILSFQQLSTGLPVDVVTAKPWSQLTRRAPPIPLRPIPEPVIAPKPEPPLNPAEPPAGGVRFGSGDKDPTLPPTGIAPPRFGGDPVDTSPAPKVATLGTEDDIARMGLRSDPEISSAFDRFSVWFQSHAANTENPWIFHSGLKDAANDPSAPGGGIVPKFQEGFNKEGKYRVDGETDQPPIQQLRDTLSPLELLMQVGKQPTAQPKMWDMSASYAAARLAAIRGGNVRILMRPDAPNTPEGRFWTNFEAYEVTKPGSNVQGIWRYNADDLDAPPTKIWTQGDPTMGNPPDFSPPRADSPDSLIDLDF